MKKIFFLSLAALLTLAACSKNNTTPDPQDDNTVTWKGVTYKTVKLKDGNTWFAENLRYVPEGITPSNDLKNVTAGVYYPVVVNSEQSAAEFSTDPDVIKERGYLYQAEVALGLEVGALTSVDQAKALKGAQGLCPDGWHIPTGDDIIGLVGKSATYDNTSYSGVNEDAPYYDKTAANGSIVLLNKDGFNMDAFGAVSIANNTSTSGTFVGYMKAYNTKISSGMFCGSTYAGVTYNTAEGASSAAGDASSDIKNLQFYGFMPMTNKATEAEYTCNGTKVSYRIACPIRCIKNK